MNDQEVLRLARQAMKLQYHNSDTRRNSFGASIVDFAFIIGVVVSIIGGGFRFATWIPTQWVDRPTDLMLLIVLSLTVGYAQLAVTLLTLKLAFAYIKR